MEGVSHTGKLTICSAFFKVLQTFCFSDLKPDNIVLTKDGEVRLIDFSHFRNLVNSRQEILPKQVAQYSSPEVFKCLPAGLASDWWSYGVIIAYLYQLKLPFEGDTPDKIQEHARSGEPKLENVWPSEAKKLIKECLFVDPEKRPLKVSTHKLFENIRFAAANGLPKKKPFVPGPVKIPVTVSSKQPVYVTDDPLIYEELEASVIRIPSVKFLEAKSFKRL